MLFLRAIKNISGNPDSSNKTRMTTRSLGYNALFHLKTNATLLDLRRICEDFAPVKYSSMLLYPDVFSLPPRILHPRRTSSRTRSPFLRLLSFSLPNLPFEQQLLARNSDPWTWRIRSHRLEKSRRAWFDILLLHQPLLLRVLPTSHGSPQRGDISVSGSAIKWNTRAILSSRDSCLAAFFPARVKAGQIEF